jgi:protein-tyrosine phosphatase
LVLLSREEATARLTPNVRIGRLLLPGELPEEIEVVVDLTSELPATPVRRANVEYLSFPILDATAPEGDRLVELVADLGKKGQTQLYVHCAQGHGRTGLVAALLLIAGGKAGSFAEAMEEVRRCRPGVAVNREQRTVGEKAARLLVEAADRQDDRSTAVRRPPHDTCNQDQDPRAQKPD